jgi:hypothetical protein
MRAYVTVGEVQRILNLAPKGGERPASRCSRFIIKEGTSYTHWIRGLVSLELPGRFGDERNQIQFARLIATQVTD